MDGFSTREKFWDNVCSKVISIYFYIVLSALISFHVIMSCLFYQTGAPQGQESGFPSPHLPNHRNDSRPQARLPGTIRGAGLASFTLSTCSRWHGVYANVPPGERQEEMW